MGPEFPSDLNLADYYLYARIADGLADKNAILFGAHAYTYGEVAERSSRFAASLTDADVRRGERVLIALPDIPPFAWVFFGTLRAGAVVAMANPDAGEENLLKLIAYTRATAVVTVPKLAQAIAKARTGAVWHDELRRVYVAPYAPTDGDPLAQVDVPDAPGFVALEEALAQAAAVGGIERGHRVTGRDEPAIWLFTSGSTGEPKANIHAHRDFAFNTEVYAKSTVGYRASDITVSVPRLFFGYATGTNLMFPFAVGATTALFSERPTPESVIRAVERYKPTVVTNVPTMLGKILDHDAARKAEGGAPIDWSSVRFCLSAGEALPGPLLQRWQARFDCDVYDGIGSAEMFHIYVTNRPGDIRVGSLGKVVDGYEIRVLPESADGPGASPCAPNEIGVLWVRGPSASMGYWLDRDKSFRTFYGAWCKTGDLFWMDESGYLYFAGRADDLIKVGGQWVAPREVEDCLLSHANVAAVAVVGVQSDGLIKPKAFVVRKDGGKLDDPALVESIQEHVKERLAKHKYPRIVELVDDLPKNDRGKVDKKALIRRSEGA